jgi:hypothetical protein
MVLAQRVEGDVFDHDHLVVVLVEDRVGDHFLRLDVVAVGQLAQSTGHAVGRRAEALPARVLAELDQ